MYFGIPSVSFILLAAALFAATTPTDATASLRRVEDSHPDTGMKKPDRPPPPGGPWSTWREFEDSGARCKTPDPTESERKASDNLVRMYKDMMAKKNGRMLQYGVITVKTYFHILDKRITQAMIDAQKTTLMDAFINTNTNFRFDIEVIQYQDTNSSGDNYSKYMTDTGSAGYTQSNAIYLQAAHRRGRGRGKKSILNVFFTELTFGILGWAKLPSPNSGSADDGVMNLWSSMNNGTTEPYNEGDTLVHEVGHWLGLQHTFSGDDCTGFGDFVGDTPFEAGPAYGCPIGRDTCLGGGPDPIHNYMDYTDDNCMDDFTFDQNNRMVAHWNAFRSLSPPPPPIDCVNIPANWYDIYGDSCDWYANGNNCAFYGSDFAHPDFNSTALEACCVCGPTTTPEPTITPEPTVTFEPTLEPTLEPTNEPTITFEPTWYPTAEPTYYPTAEPTYYPTAEPTWYPTDAPTISDEPTPLTFFPTEEPTITFEPTEEPTISFEPSSLPTLASDLPSSVPSARPSAGSDSPSVVPSPRPSAESDSPSSVPSPRQSAKSDSPSSVPSLRPSAAPSAMPSFNPSLGPSSHPSISDAPSAMPSSRPSKRPTKRPTPAPRPPPTRSPTKLPSSRPSSVPSGMSAMPSTTASSTPSALSSSNPSATSSTSPSTASSSPSISPSSTVSSMPSATPTISHAPSTMPSSQPSTDPSSPPSFTLSSTPSSQPSPLPSSSPTPECQDFANFDQNMFSFQDFGLNSVAIVFQGTLSTGDFEDATCDALKDQGEELGVDIVSCCASSEFIPNGRRLQDGNTTTVPVAVVEFTTAIAYTVNFAVTDDIWQVAFADAINSEMFGDMIGGTVEDLQQLSSGASEKSMKSSKSAVVSGGSKSSKSASSTGGSNMSSKSMKSASSSSF